MKFAPFTVKVKPDPPALTTLGLTDAMLGAGVGVGVGVGVGGGLVLPPPPQPATKTAAKKQKTRPATFLICPIFVSMSLLRNSHAFATISPTELCKVLESLGPYMRHDSAETIYEQAIGCKQLDIGSGKRP